MTACYEKTGAEVSLEDTGGVQTISKKEITVEV